MEVDLVVIKDIIIVVAPIVIAIISYFGGKKTRKEIMNDLEKSLREKDAETTQILAKISAELESQKQLAVWNNSLPQTDKYIEMAGMERYGNVCSLTDMLQKVYPILWDENTTVDELNDIKMMLGKIKLPLQEENLYPYEIPYIYAYKKMLLEINKTIRTKSTKGAPPFTSSTNNEPDKN